MAARFSALAAETSLRDARHAAADAARCASSHAQINGSSTAVPIPLQPIHMVNPAHENVVCEGAVCPSIFIPLSRIWNELHKYAPERMSHYVQNVGAKDGISGPDPLYTLFMEHPSMSGTAFEPNEGSFAKLTANIAKFTHYKPVNKGISPSSALEILKYDVLRHGKSLSMDIFKLDIDACECHILEILFASSSQRWLPPKVIQVELNHILAPPISYRDMCSGDTWGRSTFDGKRYGNLDVWGCSMQAAADLLGRNGYRLLQYDWPDGTFLHEEYAGAFPCFHLSASAADFMRSYWTGFVHARSTYKRFKKHQTNKGFNEHMVEFAESAAANPVPSIRHIITRYNTTWLKSPLWVEIGVAGTAARVNITRARTGDPLNIEWSGTAE